MTKDELIKQLKDLLANKDQEMAHVEADDLLLKFINDKEISEAYESIEKWYA